MAGPIRNFCGAKSGSFGSNLSITSIILLPLDSQVIRKSDPPVLNVTKCLANHLSSCWGGGWQCLWTPSQVNEWNPMHTRNILSGVSLWFKVVIVISPTAFEHRDVVLLSFPGCEVNAGLQSVLVECLQDHSLCIHVYTIHNEKRRKVWISKQELPWCVTVTQSHLNCPPGSKGWLWANDTSLQLSCFCPASDKHEENNIWDGHLQNKKQSDFFKNHLCI